MEKCKLEDLVGEHILDGVDTYQEKVPTYFGRFEDANFIKFRLDGIVYVAIENPDDGYRSSMDKIYIATSKKDRIIKNAFTGCRVLGAMKKERGYQHDVLQLTDMVTGKVVLEVGTYNSDDYYPYFVSTFTPENMAINQPSKYEG